MNKSLKLLLLISFIFTAPYVAAATVSEKILQKGLFSPPKCDGTTECLCEADIKYPVISGMQDDGKQNIINDAIRKSADQLKCQGEPAQTRGKSDNFSVRHGYEVTFQSPAILGFKFTDWAYEGGAHGNGSVDGLIIDLESGKMLTPDDIFGLKNIVGVNQVIYDALAPKSDGIFRDEIESRKGAFIKDGKCQGCTIVLGKEGVQVIFQSYEVAPFSDGTPTIAIPARYISYPAIARALVDKSSSLTR